jgi:hypothetical protein
VTRPGTASAAIGAGEAPPFAWDGGATLGGDTMRSRRPIRKSAPLGELVAAAFDSAARFSSDPREVSRFAAQVVRHMLRRACAFGDARVEVARTVPA